MVGDEWRGLAAGGGRWSPMIPYRSGLGMCTQSHGCITNVLSITVHQTGMLYWATFNGFPIIYCRDESRIYHNHGLCIFDPMHITYSIIISK